MHICDMNDLMQIWETNGFHSKFLSLVANSSVRIFMVHGLAVDGGIRVTHGSRSEFSLHSGPNREHF